MAIESFTLGLKWAWKLVTWLPGALLKWTFSQTWFQSQVKIDLRPRYEAVTLFAGDKKDITIWLRVTNFTYFDIEIDRLIIEFHSAGHSVKLIKLDREIVSSLTQHDLMLQHSLTSDHVAAIERTFNNHQKAVITVHAEINSKVHNFKLDLSLSEIQPRLNNFKLASS
jgi:hypothetical protein